MVCFVRGLISAEEDEEDEKQKEYGKVLEPYAAGMAEKVGMLLKEAMDKGYGPMQEEVLALLSCMANVLGEKFAAYYDAFMPGLKQILLTMPMTTKEQQELRAHCTQTLGFILTALKSNTSLCRQDALDIARALTQLLVSGQISEADPQILAIQNTLSQIGACIKGEFKEFLPHIMPALIKDATRDIDLKIKDAELAGKEDKGEGVASFNVKIRGFEGERQITMNTNALENKINALQIIKNLASSLGTGFFEQVEPVTQIIINDLLGFKYSKAVRKTAA